jgi:hypothetical protein
MNSGGAGLSDGAAAEAVTGGVPIFNLGGR